MAFCTRESSGKSYRDHFAPGTYVCVECSHPLFSSQAKYAHDTPWPAFTKPMQPDSLRKEPEPDDDSMIKLLCGACGHSLGHEFLNDGPTDGSSRF